MIWEITQGRRSSNHIADILTQTQFRIPEDNANFGVARAEIAAAVAPGQDAVFTFNAVPPANGTVNFRWRMARNTASFGPLTPNVAVSVSGTNNAQFVSQSVPASMSAGQTYAVSITLQNTGTNTWTPGTAHRLGPQNPADNNIWGTGGRVYLPAAASIAPGSSHTFSFNVTAPVTPGTYNFQWKAVRDGFEWFGPLTPNVAVVVATPNAAFVSQSVPAAMTQAASHPVSITLTNTGSVTWLPGQHYLRSQNPQDNSTWGVNRVELPGTVAPSQNVTFNFNAVPATNGTFDFQWRMAEGTTSFGASTPNVAVAVDGTENAQFISQVVPTTLGPGQTQLMRITLQNTGQTTWTTAGGFQLGSQAPPDNTTWGPSRVALPHSVSPGQSVVFSFPVTAPSSTGSYDFQWRMVQGATWFGDPSSNTSISVQTQTSTVGYIHVDHLNTPRAVFDANQQLRWKWEQQEPFGVNAPDENPSSLGAFEFALRFPGQYFDKETNLHYNYFRDFDPGLGTYKESDPMGLNGGINTYSYVGAAPLVYADPLGLWATWVHRMMTEEAMAVTECKVSGLPRATAKVDSLPNSQDPQNSYWHHMSDGASKPPQTPEEAATAYGTYMTKYRGSCEIDDFARVLHGMQDSFSPAHRNFQPWSGFGWSKIPSLIAHGFVDAFPSNATWERAVAATAAEIAAFKARCPCACK